MALWHIVNTKNITTILIILISNIRKLAFKVFEFHS